MSDTISEPNKHIQEYLDYYCADILNDYAVLIKGTWGSGKTWFIKEYIKKLKQNGFKRVIYISLNGVSKKDAIDDMIFCELHPVLSHRATKVLSKVATGLLKASTKIDLNNENINETSLSISLPKVDISEAIKKGERLILIFDDLERCQMQISEILGYINYFVEHTESRAIILANEEKLSTCVNYKKEKEKLVGATFEFHGDIRSALNHFINELPRGGVKFKLQSETVKDNIVEIYKKSKLNNIRSLKQTLKNFTKFYDSDFFKNDDNLFNGILQLFFIFSMEYKNNGFAGNILDFEISDNCEETNKISTRSSFKEKYDLNHFGTFLLNDGLWNDILANNIIDKNAINRDLENNYFRYLEEPPEWLKLWKYYDLSNLEFNEIIEKAKYKIINSECMEFGEVIHLIAELMYFNKKGIVEIDVKSLKKSALINIETIHKDRGHEYVAEFKLDQFSPSWGGYFYMNSDDHEFKKFRNTILAHLDKLNESLLRSEADQLLNLMKNDPDLFYHRLCMTSNKNNLYWNVPVLNEILPESFAKIYCDLDLESFKKVYSALSNRYKTSSNILNLLQPEKEWFAKVIKHVEDICGSKTGVEKLKLEDYSLKQLKIIYKNSFF